MANFYEELDKKTGGKLRKAFNSLITGATNHYQKKYGFDIGEGEHATWNNEADAFKHAFMQWALDYYIGGNNAKQLGDMHEDETPNAPYGERNMDLWNNSIGREVSREMKNGNMTNKVDPYAVLSPTKAAGKIVDKMRQGQMITSPNDVRDYENMEYERLTNADRVYYKNEFKDRKQDVNDEIMSGYLNQAIDNNWNIDTRESLDKRVKNGELIYIDGYNKRNGQILNGYYKRYPKY